MIKTIWIITLVVFMYSCSSVKVTSDYDEHADFTKFKTYAFGQEALDLPLDNANRNYVLEAVEDEMLQRGYKKSDKPDLIVEMHLKTDTEVTASGSVSKSYGYSSGFSLSSVSYNEHLAGTLFIFIVNEADQQIIWQGTGTKTIDEEMSPANREKTIRSGIKQVMVNYPPK